MTLLRPGALATVHERVAANLRRLGLPDEALAGISGHGRLAGALEGAELVFEAAPEDVDLKIRLIEEITTEAAATRVRLAEHLAATLASRAPASSTRERLDEPASARPTP